MSWLQWDYTWPELLESNEWSQRESKIDRWKILKLNRIHMFSDIHFDFDIVLSIKFVRGTFSHIKEEENLNAE